MMWKFSLRTVMLLLCCIAAPAYANLIDNGTFAAGLSGWNYSGDVSVGFASSDTPGMDGAYALLGADPTRNGSSSLSQKFSILGLSEIEVSFDWFFRYTDRAPLASDTFAALLWEGGIGLPPVITYEMLEAKSVDYTVDRRGIVSGHFHDIYDLGTWFPLVGGITFTLLESPSIGTLISSAGVDNVSVAVPVPEPSALVVMGSVILGLSVRRWVHRKG